MDKILLIDGLNAIFRASIKFGPQNHYQIESNCFCKSPWNVENNFCYGEKYGIIFNFFRNLRPLVEMFSPDKIIFGLEGRPQFRYDLYPEYKANRIIKTASKQDNMDKFHESKNEIIKLIHYLPITVAKADKYECDDLIASLCENLKSEDLTVITNDSDYIQLLQRNYERIQIYNPIKKEFMTAPSYHYVAWKSLAGDKSDNIFGLVTNKKAEKLINDPKLFEDFLSIEENRANFSINRQLIEFANVDSNEINFTEGECEFDKLKEEFEFMKFFSMTNEKSWKKYTSTFDCVKF
jgi:5'-3' exonuclease